MIAQTFTDILKKLNKWCLYVGLNVKGVDDIAIEGGEEPKDFHVTLLYGNFDPNGRDEDAIAVCVNSALEKIRDMLPDTITFKREGRFEASESSDGKDVIFAEVEAGQLEEIHETLLDALNEEGITVEKTFDEYHPHMTLAYIDQGAEHELKSLDHKAKTTDIKYAFGEESTHENEYKFAKALEGVAKTFAEILKFNPYHDERGRFATANGAASFTYAPGKSKAHDNAIAREKGKQSAGAGGSEEWNKKMDAEMEAILSEKPSEQALFLLDHGMLDYDDAVAAMKSKTTEPYIRNYFAIMKENGDPTSTKPLSDNGGSRNQDVRSGKYKDHDEAKREFVKEKTGMNDADADTVSREMTTWTSNSWDKADTAVLDKFIEQDHTYDGEIFRGMHFDNDGYNSFMQNIELGSTISMKRNSSWSSNEDDARVFAHTGDDEINSVMIRCVKNRSASPIKYLNSQGEDEVIGHSKAKWTVLNSQTTETSKGTKKTWLTVIEKGE